MMVLWRVEMELGGRFVVVGWRMGLGWAGQAAQAVGVGERIKEG